MFHRDKKTETYTGLVQSFSAVFAVLVFASTQFTKQHYIIDVFAGAAIAELSYFIGTHINFYKRYGDF